MDNSTSAAPYEYNAADQAVVISAIFTTPQAAQATVRELREVGISPESISLIARDEDHTSPDGAMRVAGAEHEDVGEETLTYRVSRELPNDEDLPTTEAAMTGQPATLDGVGERVGLAPGSDLVRTPEAEPSADEDIYTDFPNSPGGVNPDFREAATRAGADVQEPMRNRTHAGGAAVAGVGLGSVAGLLVGIAGLAIPGIGPFIAAGPLAGALGGMVAGGAAGGIIGA